MTETDDPADLGEVDTDDIDSEDEAGVVPAPVDDYKNGVDSRLSTRRSSSATTWSGTSAWNASVHRCLPPFESNDPWQDRRAEYGHCWAHWTALDLNVCGGAQAPIASRPQTLAARTGLAVSR